MMIFLKKNWKNCVRGIILCGLSGTICAVISSTGLVYGAEVQDNKNFANTKNAKPGTENIQNPAADEDDPQKQKKPENARKVVETDSCEQEIQALRRENSLLRKQLAAQRDMLKRMEQDARAKDEEDMVLSGEAALIEAELTQLRKALNAERKKQKAANPVDRKEVQQEILVLRKELIETLERCSTDLERLKSLELSAASILDTLSPVYMTARETEMAETLELVMSAGRKLSGVSALMSDKLLQLLPKVEMDEVERAKLRVELEDMRAKAVNFARLDRKPGSPEGFVRCRILEIDEATGAVVLSAGYRDGVRVNLTLYAENGAKTPLKVVSVRTFVSAAIPEEDALQELVPGMQVGVKK